MGKKDDDAKAAVVALEPSKKETLKAELNALVVNYNDVAELALFKDMKKISEQIAEKAAEYNKESEMECFAELRKAENPLKAAAVQLRFGTVKTKEEKLVGGGMKLVVDDSTKAIDPLSLHKAIDGGIGADKNWFNFVEKLNRTLIGRRAIELGIDPKAIDASYAMSEEAKKLEGFLSDEDPTKFNLNDAFKHTKENMQKVVVAMIGDGYELQDYLVSYLLSIYTKKDSRTSLSVTAANRKFLRQYMLEVCHGLITGDKITLNYKAKKN